MIILCSSFAVFLLQHRLILRRSRLNSLVQHPELRNVEHWLFACGCLPISVLAATSHKLPTRVANGLCTTKVRVAVRTSGGREFIGLALRRVAVLPDVRYSHLSGSRSANSLLGRATARRTIFHMKIAFFGFIDVHDVFYF